MIDVDARGRYEAELLREEAARMADTETALQSVLAGDVVVPLEPHRPAPVRPVVARRPVSMRRRMQVLAGLAAAAAVVAVLAFLPGNDPEVVPTATTAVTSSTELVVRPLDPPIHCELERCPSLAVSPEGTLVAYDQAANTLTWYYAEPHVSRHRRPRRRARPTGGHRADRRRLPPRRNAWHGLVGTRGHRRRSV